MRRLLAAFALTLSIVGATAVVDGTPGSAVWVPKITLAVSPNPLIESGVSEVRLVFQVSMNASFSNSIIVVSADRLALNCVGGIIFGSLQPTIVTTANSIQLLLDGDGHAAGTIYGLDCQPGRYVIEASMLGAPYATTTTPLRIVPPHPTKPGVAGAPVDPVETGNTPTTGESNLYVVFTVEANPVYAEQTIQITSPQLFERCGVLARWLSNNGVSASPTFTATLDNAGSATFFFIGASCAAGKSTVITSVEAGNHPGYSMIFAFRAPKP